MFGLTENVMRWSLDQPVDPQPLQNSFKSFDMRQSNGSMSIFMKQDKDQQPQTRDNRNSDQSMFCFLKNSEVSSNVSGFLAGPQPARNSRGSNEFNPRIIMSNSMKGSIENQAFPPNDNRNSFVPSNRGSIPEFYISNLNMSGVTTG
jgi:hypothetical protein